MFFQTSYNKPAFNLLFILAKNGIIYGNLMSKRKNRLSFKIYDK